jgi:hypothetical protein
MKGFGTITVIASITIASFFIFKGILSYNGVGQNEDVETNNTPSLIEPKTQRECLDSIEEYINTTTRRHMVGGMLSLYSPCQVYNFIYEDVNK